MEKSVNKLKIRRHLYKIIFIFIVIYFIPKNKTLSDTFFCILTNRVILIYIYLTLLYDFKEMTYLYKNENIMIRSTSKDKYLKFCNSSYNKLVLKELLIYILSVMVISLIMSYTKVFISTVFYMFFYTIRYSLVLITILNITVHLLYLKNVFSVIFTIFNCLMMFLFYHMISSYRN